MSPFLKLNRRPIHSSWVLFPSPTSIFNPWVSVYVPKISGLFSNLMVPIPTSQSHLSFFLVLVTLPCDFTILQSFFSSLVVSSTSSLITPYSYQSPNDHWNIVGQIVFFFVRTIYLERLKVLHLLSWYRLQFNGHTLVDEYLKNFEIVSGRECLVIIGRDGVVNILIVLVDIWCFKI